MKKIMLTIALSLVCSSVSAKTLLCTEQFVGVVELADGRSFAAPITEPQKNYRNKVVDNGNSFTVTLNKGYKLSSGPLKTLADGSQTSEKNGLSYKKFKGVYLIGESEHEPRYREWTVYKNCVETYEDNN